MYARLRRLSLAERLRIKGLEPERADLIIPGIILTISLMETLGFKDIRISERGLLEGVVLELAREASR
jgi:exopolyphosphatase/guanosine-5'-triphosphate,3'-diphosphate pyrophosphatase